MASKEGREYDLVVFGSTGYTGKFVAEEVYRLQCEGRRSLRWAAAGRSEAKVRACLEASGIEDVDVLVADVSDQSSIDAMCARASVIIDCVGPYMRFGEPVVKACISQKCNYVDITGETYYMEKMLAQYGEEAKEAGVYIVSACGFDSIPNDVGTLLLEKSFQGELAYVDSFMTTDNVDGFHLGTWESFLLSIKNHRKLLQLRQEQKPERTMPKPTTKPTKRRFMFYSDLVRRWCLMFPGPDRSIVYRSQGYRHETEGTQPYTFRTYFGLNSLLQCIGMIMFFCVLLVLVSTNIGLKLMLKFPKFFSGGTSSKQGPSKKQLENGTFTLYLEGFGYSRDCTDRSKPPDSKILVKVRGAEPGYVATSAMLVQSALCLLDEKDSLPSSGGIYTPAVAFGNTNLIKNLENTGKVRFEVTQN